MSRLRGFRRADQDGCYSDSAVIVALFVTSHKRIAKMAERAVFIFSSDTAADEFVKMTLAWPAPCKKLVFQTENSLIHSARMAGDFLVDGLQGMEVSVVSAELQKPLDIKFSTALRISFGEDLLVALWFSKKLEAKVKSFDLAASRLNQISRALQKIEQVSFKHMKAVEKAFPKEGIVNMLPMDVYFRVIEAEFKSLYFIMYQEVSAALI